MTTQALRCKGKQHGILLDTGAGAAVLEFKCGSRLCGAGPGVVVLHRFDTRTWEEIETLRFRDPGSNPTVERR